MVDKNSGLVIYDATLREGNQSLHVGFSLHDKLHIAERLSSIGIHYIEGGWPNPTNTIDCAFYSEVKSLNLQATITAFGSTKRRETKPASDPFLQMLLGAQTSAVTIFGKSWDLHVEKVLQCSLTENLDLIFDSVYYLKKQRDEVIYDAEHFFDGYKHNREYALQTLETAQQAGADTIVLCDTNGGFLPKEFLACIRDVASKITTKLGVHIHNDSGCADANSLLAYDEGFTHIQATLQGIGERCGNANICTILPNLQLKRNVNIVSDKQLQKLTETSIYFTEVANLVPNIRLPYVGECAFSHKAGAHIDGVRKAHESFEHIQPETVGNNRHFVLSDQAGSGTIVEKIKHIKPDLDKRNPLVQELLYKLKTMESEGYHFEAAEASFELIIHKHLSQYEEPFSVEGFRVVVEQRSGNELYAEAVIKVKKDGIIQHTAADGDGPVNALDRTLKKALGEFYPSVRNVALEDFKVRVLNGKKGTAAKVRVLIESTDSKERWGTIGVSTNIIEASFIALMDSVKYKVYKESVAQQKEMKIVHS